MCQKSPGARCSGHTFKQLETKKAAHNRVAVKLAETNKAATAAAKTGKENLFRKLNTAATEYENRLNELEIEISHIQRDYDGTPKGQAELQAILDNPNTTPEEYNAAVSRMNKGAALRSLRNNLLQIAEEKRTSQVRQSIFGLDGGSFSKEYVK
jgi:hypothetical protein